MAKSLIIDPGHGGIDPGTNGFGVQEKEWNLKISLYQYDRLNELGANVAITRTSDKTLQSGPRTNLIRDKYDLCISNHFNGFNGTARGVETIHSIYADNTNATKIANAIVDASGLPLRRVFSRRGSSGDYYFMHRLTGGTQTTIIEYGFMDNKEDHDFYKNDENFYKVAEVVVKELCGILGVDYKKPGTKSDSKPSKSSSKKSKSISQMADEVIAGDHGTGHANRRKSLDISKSEYEKVRAEVNRRAGATTAPKPKKSLSQMIQEVIDGKHGNGHETRRKSLGINATEYAKVRQGVNDRLSRGGNQKTISQMATEVIEGKHGNGHENRRKSLGISTEEYAKVRREVNRRV